MQREVGFTPWKRDFRFAMSERFWLNTGRRTFHCSCANVSTNLKPSPGLSPEPLGCSLPPPGLRSLGHLVWFKYHERESLPVVGYKVTPHPFVLKMLDFTLPTNEMKQTQN